jgi:hypothetical protein
MDDRLSSAKVRQLLDRGEFLKLAGAAGLGVAAGSTLLSGEAGAAVRTNLDPTDFTFRTREQFRPFHLLAQNFVQLDDNFEDGSETYTTIRPGPPSEDDGFTRVENGRMRFDGQDDYYTILVSDTGQEAPFSTVIVDVASLPEKGTIYAGLYRVDGNEFVHAYYDSDTNTVGFEVRVNGQDYRTKYRDPNNPDDPFSMGDPAEPEQRLFEEPFRFAFVANENRVIALVSSASDLGGWRPIIERDIFFETNGQMDLRDQSRLEPEPTAEPSPTALKNGFGARSETGSTILFDRVQAGYFGEAGVRDPHAVQYADGTPYIKNNKLYFTQTNAGLGFFEKAHWGVWTLDLDDYTKIEQVGNIFWRNLDSPTVPSTKVLGHHAGQIVRDEEAGRWIVVASTWGDFGPQGGDGALVPGVITYPDKGSFGEPVRDPEPENPDNPLVPVEPGYEPPVDIVYAEELGTAGGLPLSTDILRGVHVLEGKKHPVNNIPFQTEGKWDPGLTRINGRWYMAYVIALDLFSNFQPALARSPIGGDHTQTVEFVGADWEKRATEGPIIQKLGGEWRLFASCGDDEPPEFQGRYPIYFLESANPEAPDGSATSDEDRPRDFDPNRKEPPTEEEERLRRLAFDGYLDAPHPTNIPHPQIVPISYRSNGRTRTKYIMISFNGDQYYIERLGYGTHGDFYVMQAEETVRGREFPRR